MSSNTKQFYNEVDSVKRQDTIDFLVHNQTPIIIKIGSQYIRSKIMSLSGQDKLVTERSSLSIEGKESVICSFEIKAEKYFFNTEFSVDNGRGHLAVPQTIFQLQRRNDFRINVPMSVPYTCVITSANDATVKWPAEIRDMSLGGCQLVLKKPDMNFEGIQDLTFDLKIRAFEFENVSCQAKHIMLIQAGSKIQIGAKYLTTDADFLADVQSLLVQLDRIHRGKGEE